MDQATIDVVHVPEKRRYELRDGGKAIGAAHYRRLPGQVVFTHTKVSDAYAGQGLGAVLARSALDDVRADGLRIVPVCPFIAAYLRRHHEYDDIVDPPPAPAVSGPRATAPGATGPRATTPGTTAPVAGSSH